MTTIFDRMRHSFPDKDYRHTYANGVVDSKLATQLKVLREQRRWTQAQLAEKSGMQQARISVLEDVNYSAWSISTLRRIGKAFDLWLDVEWKEFGELPSTLKNMSRETLERESFDNDPVFHEREAASTTAQTAQTVPKNPVADSSPYIETNTNKNFSLNTTPLVGADGITIALSTISIAIIGKDQRQTGINQDTFKADIRAVSFGNTVLPSNLTSEVNRNRKSREAGIYVAGPIGTAA